MYRFNNLALRSPTTPRDLTGLDNLALQGDPSAGRVHHEQETNE